MILYKYRSDSQVTEDIYTKIKVWLSKPNERNNTFECLIESISSKILLSKLLRKKLN